MLESIRSTPRFKRDYKALVRKHYDESKFVRVLELLFMGSISIGAYVPPDATTGGVLSAAFAISLGQGTETAIALAMPIATLSLALGNAINALGPLLLGIADKSVEQGNVGSIYAIHWILGLLGVLKRFGLCFVAFYFGAEAVQGVLDCTNDSQQGVAAVLLSGLLADFVYECSRTRRITYCNHHRHREVWILGKPETCTCFGRR